MIGELGIETLRNIKKTVDPKNVFANGNLFDV
jgi:FAD/FMN-containing dehydrogenase